MYQIISRKSFSSISSKELYCHRPLERRQQHFTFRNRRRKVSALHPLSISRQHFMESLFLASTLHTYYFSLTFHALLFLLIFSSITIVLAGALRTHNISLTQYISRQQFMHSLFIVITARTYYFSSTFHALTVFACVFLNLDGCRQHFAHSLFLGGTHKTLVVC